MESFYETIQQITPWTWIIILISVIWYVLSYRKRKRIIRESQRVSNQYQKEYYDCFDDDGNLDEGKYKEFIKKQKKKQKKTLLNSNSLGDRDETRFWM